MGVNNTFTSAIYSCRLFNKQTHLIMKKHFISLFDRSHRKTTVSLLLSSFILIIISQIIGISDNVPGILLLLAGMILLFYSLVHPWKNKKNYSIMAWIFTGIIALLFLIITFFAQIGHPELIDKYIGETAAMVIVFLICIPGIIVGIYGTFVKRGK